MLARGHLTGALPVVDGSNGTPPSDGVGVVWDNLGNNVIDAYLHREVRYEARYDRSTGTITGTVTVTLVNDAPATGLPPSVIGNATGAPPGTSSGWLSLYTADSVDAVTVDGTPAEATANRQGSWNAYSLDVAVAPQSRRTVTFHVTGTLDADTPYSLVVRAQPSVRPDTLDVKVSAPAGAVLASHSGDITATLQLGARRSSAS